jgi:DNA polymerase (family 10)
LVARSNDLVAQMLYEFADLLAISGGDQFKVRAYEKAARAVEGYHTEVDRLDEHELDAIPSVGSHIARKIAEYLSTGTVDELDDLRSRVPAGLRTLLAVPGLGPKRARQAYDELGLTSLSELLDALHEQRLRRLRGWGARSEENLAKAIHDAQTGGGRIPLGIALGLAEDLLDALSAVGHVSRAAYAGSLRRMRDTIGDIDLLVASDQPEPVMQAFTGLPLVGRVVAQGPTRSSVVTTKGVQVDLRVIDPSVWGAALMYFTGSKAHNIKLRRLAERAGWKLSEYGLFEADTDRLLASQTEDDVYHRLGLPWVPPTIREDTGEIEAAIAGQLPQLVELREIRGDLHTHTNLTDGVASLSDMVAAAKKHRYRYYAITDHAPLLYMQRMTADKAVEQRRQIKQLERQTGMVLLHGSELNIQPDGTLDWDDDFLAGFDITVASVHSAFRQSRKEMTARLLCAVENPHVNVLGHPTGRVIGHRPAIDADWDAVFRAAAGAGTALEINSFPDRLDLSDELIRRAGHAGAKFVVSTDAHAVPHLDYMRFGVATAQRGWVEPAEVINTWPLPRLRHFLAKQRPPRRQAG